MTVTTELELRIAQDEFNFFRSQLAQSWLLAFEAAILALITSPLHEFRRPLCVEIQHLEGLPISFGRNFDSIDGARMGIRLGSSVLLRLARQEGNECPRSFGINP